MEQLGSVPVCGLDLNGTAIIVTQLKLQRDPYVGAIPWDAEQDGNGVWGGGGSSDGPASAEHVNFSARVGDRGVAQDELDIDR
nr:hypothetical protein [Planobispora siamensis]